MRLSHSAVKRIKCMMAKAAHVRNPPFRSSKVYESLYHPVLNAVNGLTKNNFNFFTSGSSLPLRL